MILAAAFVFGAMVGSFLNVCILRMPIGESIVYPASHCPACQRSIAWYDNIPLASFLLLKGKCRNCSSVISWQYPLIEFITACLFVSFYVFFGLTVQGFIFLILTLAFLVESIIDLRYQIIPDAITLPGILIGFCVSAVFPSLHDQTLWWQAALQSLIGILFGGGFLFVLGTVAEWILKKEAMGGGDVKLLAMIGSVLGWKGVLWTLFFSSVLGSVIGFYFKLKSGEEKIPFGPYIAAAAFSYLFVGERLVDAYFNFLIY